MAKKTRNEANGLLLLKKWWFWLIFVVALGTMVAFGKGTDTEEARASDTAAQTAIANFEEMAAAASIEQAEADKRVEAAVQAAEEKANAEAQAKLKDPANYRTDITYDQLAQTPDDYYSQMIAMSGRVLQVMQGEGSSQMLVAVDDKDGAVIFLEYQSNIIGSGILENDFIKFYGMAAGTISYDSSLGETITVPAAFVNMLELK